VPKALRTLLCAIWTLLDWFAIQCNTRRIDCKLIPLVPLGESNDNSHLETAQDSGLYIYIYICICIYDFCLDSRPTFLFITSFKRSIYIASVFQKHDSSYILSDSTLRPVRKKKRWYVKSSHIRHNHNP